MLETMGEDYIRTARAKGLKERTVVVKHGLRSALTPILTIFGLDFGLLIGGAVLTETVFGLPGLGQLAIDVDQDQRPAPGAGRRPDHGALRGRVQPDRRPALRRHRPESEDHDDHHARPPRRAPRRRRPPYLDVQDLQVHFKTDDGVVKSVDGLSFHVERGRPSASWGSRAPASR